MDEVEVPYGTVLYSTGEKIRYVYFPEHAMISIVAHTEEGQSAEVGLIGFEGLIGLDYLLGAENAFNDHVAQLAGKVLRLKAAAAKKEFRRGGDFHDLVTRFTRHYLLQISQTALCNRLHSLEERLARWILMSDDRSTTDRHRTDPRTPIDHGRRDASQRYPDGDRAAEGRIFYLFARLDQDTRPERPGGFYLRVLQNSSAGMQLGERRHWR